MDDIEATHYPQIEEINSITVEALSLYDVGLNVFPVIPASKKSYGPHSIITTTRLYRPSLPGLMQNSNMAVMTGRLSGNLVILDCDAWDVFEHVKSVFSAFEISAWIRNGIDGGQCWVRCRDGEIMNTHTNGVEILGNRLYSIAPPSVHPSGMVYEWDQCEGDSPPVVPFEILAALSLGLKMVSRRRARGKIHELPDVANRVLVEQDTTGYRSNSEAEFAACLSLIGVGYSDSEIMRFFSLFPPPHYEKVGETHFMRSVLEQARMKQKPMASSSVKSLNGLHSSAFEAWADAYSWPGRTGSTDRIVYLALCQRMRMHGGMPFRGSVREVAELAGVNKETAYKALGRLVKAGLIHSEGPDTQGGSRYYSLSPHVLSAPALAGSDFIFSNNQSRTVGETYTPVGDSVRVSVVHDVWHRDALGKTAYVCWRTLQEIPGLTATEMVARVGKKLPTIRRGLDKLKDHDLAHDDGQWHAVSVSLAALDEIALDKGTLGRAERRIEQHKSERERHATAIIEQQKRDWLAR